LIIIYMLVIAVKYVRTNNRDLTSPITRPKGRMNLSLSDRSK
jgi:hypothetical protein